MLPPIQEMLFVGLGGFLGANARYIMAGWVAQWTHGFNLPYGTMFVNVTGSFLLAVFGVLFAQQIRFDDNLRLFVGVGFFGAYTTFSTYANETMALIRAGDWVGGVGNMVLNNGLCLIGVILGLWLANRIW
jgi:fluoride exporter